MCMEGIQGGRYFQIQGGHDTGSKFSTLSVVFVTLSMTMGRE